MIVGEGNLKLDALNSLLMEINYPGTYALEYESDIDNPAPATKKCVEAAGEGEGPGAGEDSLDCHVV